MRRSLQRFAKEEQGSATIEALLWFGIMAPVILVIVGVAFAFQGFPAISRSIHDGHRMIATGRVRTAAEVETYIEGMLALTYEGADADVIIDGDMVDTIVTIPWSAIDLSGLLGMTGLQPITFAARNRLEWM